MTSTSSKKNITWLLVVMGLQVALIGYFYTRQPLTAAFTPKEALLTEMHKNKVDKILIESPKEKLELKKENGKWLLATQMNFPAQTKKVTTLLDNLEGFKKSWPSGKTKIAAKQFKVTEKAFEKKISIYEGGSLKNTLYLGTSPGFKKIHARANDSDLTFSINFNSYEIETKDNHWTDKDYYKINRDKIKAIKISDFTLVKNAQGKLQISNLSPNEETNTSKLNEFMSLLFPTFSDIIKKDNSLQSERKFSEYSITTQNQQTTVFTYYREVSEAKEQSTETTEAKRKESEHYILTTSMHPFAFKVNKSSLDKLFNFDRSQLVQEKKPAPTDNKQEQGNLNPQSQTVVDPSLQGKTDDQKARSIAQTKKETTDAKN